MMDDYHPGSGCAERRGDAEMTDLLALKELRDKVAAGTATKRVVPDRTRSATMRWRMRPGWWTAPVNAAMRSWPRKPKWIGGTPAGVIHAGR